MKFERKKKSFVWARIELFTSKRIEIVLVSPEKGGFCKGFGKANDRALENPAV